MLVLDNFASRWHWRFVEVGNGACRRLSSSFSQLKRTEISFDFVHTVDWGPCCGVVVRSHGGVVCIFGVAGSTVFVGDRFPANTFSLLDS